MSYGKKDEDADLGLVKVDRTQVFQEGEEPSSPPTNPPSPLGRTDAKAVGGQHGSSTARRYNLENAGSS